MTTIFWKVFRLFKLGNNKFLMVLLWDSLILFMGFFFFKHAPTQLSTLPKKREHKRSKTAVVRVAKIKGMPQLAVWNNIYQFSRCAFSAAFNQQTPGSPRNRSPPCSTGWVLPSAPSPFHQQPLALPLHTQGFHSTEDSHNLKSCVPSEWKGSQVKAGFVPLVLHLRFVTGPTPQALPLLLCSSGSEWLSRQQNTSEIRHAALPSQRRTNLFIFDIDRTFQNERKKLLN